MLQVIQRGDIAPIDVARVDGRLVIVDGRMVIGARVVDEVDAGEAMAGLL